MSGFFAKLFSPNPEKEQNRARTAKFMKIFRGELPILDVEDEAKLSNFDSLTFKIVKKTGEDGITRSYLEPVNKEDSKPDAWTWTWVAVARGIKPLPP